MEKNKCNKTTKSKMVDLRKTACIVFSLLLMYPVLASAAPTTYYVAKSGNDGNPGTYAQPWLTITKAANTMVAGDTVYVRSGTYYERPVPKNSGSAGNYITYAAYPGETVNIDGTGLSFAYSSGLFDIVGKNYIVVDGFNFKNSPGSGVRIESGASNIIVRNNTFISSFVYSPIRTGWSAGTSNVLIENNVIDRTGTMWAEMISISDTNGIIVRNNHIIRNTDGEGIDFKDGTKNGKIYNNIVENTAEVAVYIDARGDMRNFEIYDNIVHTSTADAIVLSTEADDACQPNGGRYGGVASIQNVSIYNNVVYNSATGIRIGPWQMFGSCAASIGTIKEVKVINNIFYNNGGGNDIGYDNRISVQNITIRNNIFNKNGLTVYRGSVAGDHNTFDTSGSCYGTNCVVGDPKFVNPTNSDFHIQSTSPAKDSGSQIGAPPVDFEGKVRPQGAGYDIGAYEYGSGPTPTPAPTPTPTPTPTSNPIAYWKFDENTGTTASDSSGNMNTGTINGATWIKGKIGSALKFDGINDYVNVPDSSSLDATTLTFMAWIKTNKLDSQITADRIASKKMNWNAANGWSIEMNKGGGITVLGSGTAYSTAKVLPSWDNSWHHLAVVMSGSNAVVYLDGSSKGTYAINSLVANNVPLAIGRLQAGTSYFNGTIDEVKIYNRVLNASEVAIDYQRRAGLVAYWKFDENSGSKASDSSGNANSGTINGATWTTGKNGSALKFDGINDYVNVSDSSSLDATTLTFMAWIKNNKLDSEIAYDRIASKKVNWNDANGWSIEINGINSDLAGGVTVVGSGITYTNANVLPSWDNAWHHLSVVMSGSNAVVYLDGRLKGTYAINSLVANNAPLAIGRLQAGTNYFNGTIDEVKIYDRALSASEIAADYQGGG